LFPRPSRVTRDNFASPVDNVIRLPFADGKTRGCCVGRTPHIGEFYDLTSLQ
jgi:hypothetical protein